MPTQFEIVMDKDQINRKLLLLAQPHLPTALKDLEDCYPFVGMCDSICVGICLMHRVPRTDMFELRGWAVDQGHQSQGYGKKLLLHAMDFARLHGGRYLETGCGNGQLALFATFQRMGFRVAGVWSDYYTDRQDVPPGTGGIVNRDMIRLQIDLHSFFGAAQPV